MSHANALRGTWMGRTVKTEEEFLKEMAELEQKRELSVTPMVEADTADEPFGGSSIPDPIKDSSSSISNPRLGEIFRFERLIQTNAGDFVLEGLVTEEGKWNTIKLVTDPMYVQARLTWKEWNTYSNGRGSITDNQYNRTGHGQSAHHIAPMKAVYWFMRAGYETSTRIDKDPRCLPCPSIDNLRNFLGQKTEIPFYHADAVEKFNSDILHTYHGWDGLNFDIHLLALTASWNLQEYSLDPTQPIQELLGALFGDRNIQRVATVFNWVYFNPPHLVPTLIMPESQHRSFNSVTYVSKPRVLIATNHPLDSPGPAHIIQANDSDFTPARKT